MPDSVIIDGVRYVPAGEIPPINDERLKAALESLTEIQYFSDCPHKHRALAWDALNALAPEIAELSSQSPQAAFDRVREVEKDSGCVHPDDTTKGRPNRGGQFRSHS
jgi:hypothetical protein